MKTYKDNSVCIGSSNIAMYTIINPTNYAYPVHTGFDGCYHMHIVTDEDVEIPDYYKFLFECVWFKIVDDTQYTFNSDDVKRNLLSEGYYAPKIELYLAGSTLLAKFKKVPKDK